MRQNTGSYSVQFRIESVRPSSQGMCMLGVCSTMRDPNRHPHNHQAGYVPGHAVWGLSSAGRARAHC